MRDIYKGAGLLLFTILLAGNAEALQLVYPLDGSYVTKSNYLIVEAGTDPELTGLTIEINGVTSDLIDISSTEYRAAFGDMLVVEPLFDPGENKIVVEGVLNGEKTGKAMATVYYHDRYDLAPPAGFSREVFHLPEREAPCVRCHNMTPAPDDLLSPDPRENACGSCHARMLNQAHVHGPAGVYQCTFCHELDSVPNKYQVRLEDSALCLECHDDKIKEFQQAKFVHGPVDAGLCQVCHDPHASSQSNQLFMATNDLCLSCHSAVDVNSHVTRGTSTSAHPLQGVPNPVAKGEELSCASCHNPHAGFGKSLFRWDVETPMALCAECHKK